MSDIEIAQVLYQSYAEARQKPPWSALVHAEQEDWRQVARTAAELFSSPEKQGATP